jgi:acetolactate synthase-1/3 small subunit
VGNTEQPGVSCMTIVVEGDDRIIEQVTKQLHKIVEVLKIKDVTDDEYVGRELLMLRVLANKEDRVEIMHLCEIFRIKIVDINRKSFIIEATGTHSKLNAIEEAFRPFGIQEMSRTGTIAMVRGENKPKKD